MTSPLQIVLAALERKGCAPKRRTDRHYIGKCPAHNDRRASLGIKVFDDGGVAPKCFAGCDRAAVLAAMELKPCDLFPANGHRHDVDLPLVKGKTFPSIESAINAAAGSLATLKKISANEIGISDQFEYRRDGRAVGWTVRLDLPTIKDGKQEKEFRPIIPADGGFLLNAPKVWPLYNEDAIGGAELVTLHEGERKADAAMQCGIVAVSTAGGSNAAEKTDFSRLKNAKMIAVFPDNDKPGELFAADVTRRIREVNASAILKIVRIPGLPPKGDFVDFAGEMRSGQSAEDIAAEVSRLIENAPIYEPPTNSRPPVEIIAADMLVANSPELRPVIIDGLARRGEVVNIIAAPKCGKSWAVLNLAIALSTGGRWFGFQCTQGRTLLIDNELHKETLSSRLTKVAHAHGLITGNLHNYVDVISLRGNLRNLDELGTTFETIMPGTYSVVIIDSLYRAIPPDIDENSNSDITRLYNLLDKYVAMLNATFILIHHSSKGVQGGKAATDVGAGAGAQSRAADSHATLRPHEEMGAVVLDAVVRSFPPPIPSCWRLDIPVFHPASELDPTLLQRDRRPRRQVNESGQPKPKPVPWTFKRFAERFIGKESKTLVRLQAEAGLEDIPNKLAERLARQAVEMGLAYLWPGKPRKPARYATVPEPLIEVSETISLSPSPPPTPPSRADTPTGAGGGKGEKQTKTKRKSKPVDAGMRQNQDVKT